MAVVGGVYIPSMQQLNGMAQQDYYGGAQDYRAALQGLADPRFAYGLLQSSPAFGYQFRNMLGMQAPTTPGILSNPQAYRLFGAQTMGLLNQEYTNTYPQPGPNTPTVMGLPLTQIDIQQRRYMSPQFNQYLTGGGNIPGQPGLFGTMYPGYTGNSPMYGGGGYNPYPQQANYGAYGGMQGANQMLYGPLPGYEPSQLGGFPQLPQRGPGMGYIPPNQFPVGIDFGSNTPGGNMYTPIQTYPNSPSSPYFTYMNM